MPVTPDCQPDGKSKLEILQALNWEQSTDNEDLLLDFKDTFFSDVLSCTFLIKHDISLVTTDCLRAKMNPVPVYLKPCFLDEIKKLQVYSMIR